MEAAHRPRLQYKQLHCAGMWIVSRMQDAALAAHVRGEADTQLHPDCALMCSNLKR